MLSLRAIARLAAFAMTLSWVATWAGTAVADEWLIRQHLVEQVRQWSSSPVVLLSLEASNERYADLDQAAIDALDGQWKAEREVEDQPLITAVLSSPLSNYLTRIQSDSQGLFTAIFVMDGSGLNAGQSAITSDFWQGDEAKWQKTYSAGADAVFVDEVEMDESTQAFQSQVSMSIVDPATGEVIGAITVGVNVDAL